MQSKIILLLIVLMIGGCIAAAIEANRQQTEDVPVGNKMSERLAQDCEEKVVKLGLTDYEHAYSGLTGCVVKLATDVWVPINIFYSDSKVESSTVVAPSGQADE